MLIRPTGRPAVLTKLSAVTSVAASRSRGSTPMRSATSTAGPRTSTGLPLDRRPVASSTIVGRNPRRASQYASVVPAMPAPEIRTVGPVGRVFMGAPLATADPGRPSRA